MLKLALCDDEAQQRALIGDLLSDYAAARPALSVKLSVFSSGRELLAAAQNEEFDLCVLDIVMPELSGIEVGKKLRELEMDTGIVYLTISPEYAVDSYEARAFQYLIKPVQPERLFQVLDEAVQVRGSRRAACTTIKTKDGMQRIQLDEILYVERVDRAVRYHLSNGSQLDSTTVRVPFQEETARLLADPRFFLCGASFVANLFYVTAVEKGCLRMDGGKRVPLARGLAAQARQRWSDYWLNAPGGSQA